MIVGKYRVGRQLGAGAFGQVRLCTHLDTGQEYAVKIMELNRVKELGMSVNVRREISIMKKLDHPNVIKLIEVLKSDTHIFIVCELATGGDLFDKIVEQDLFDEETTRMYFTQILDAAEYCHSKGICHRDLKPENVLLASDGSVRITDFGFSRAFLDHDTVLQVYTRCGTPNYIAPEVLSGRAYNPMAADVWSAGVVLFVMLAGYLPFDEPELETLYRKIKRGSFKFPRHIRPLARDLLLGILTINPANRLTIGQIRAHSWMLKPLLSTRKLGRKLSTQISLRFAGGAERVSPSGSEDDSYDSATSSSSPNESSSAQHDTYASVAARGLSLTVSPPHQPQDEKESPPAPASRLHVLPSLRENA
jgi:5'-AMP-activated protein kinase catalytic alpha subunit